MPRSRDDDDPWKTTVEKVTSGLHADRRDQSEPTQSPQSDPRGPSGRPMKKSPKGALERYVVPNARRGGWDVIKPESSRSSGHFTTQEAAVARARDIVSRQGGGEVVIRSKDGRIRDTRRQG
jgi:hypothetical protein